MPRDLYFEPDPKTEDPFADEIRETPGFVALGRTFTTRYAARQHVAEDKLRLALRATEARLPLVTQNLPPGSSRREQQAFDDYAHTLRAWLVEHVHTLLPALQLVALANPPVQMQPVEEPIP